MVEFESDPDRPSATRVPPVGPERIREHARTRPERSLAVLTFTEEHARRLMERIMNTVSVIPALRDYFDPGVREVFTVLPAAQATSVLRDDIIVSIGFGKTPHGRQ